MSEIPLGGPRPDPSDPWFQPFKLPPDFAPSREVEPSIEPSREASVEAPLTPVAAPPKVRHRTRASLQPAITTLPNEVAPPEPLTSRAGGPAAPMSESDRQARAAERSKPGPAAGDDPVKHDYEIGYRKPPKSGQFKPGTSGNPNGRPKGAKNFATILARELDKPIYIVEDGRRRRASRREVIVLQLIKKANAGDLKASLELIKLETQFSGSNARLGADPAADREVEQIDQDIIDAALADLLRHVGAVSGTRQSSNSRDKEED